MDEKKAEGKKGMKTSQLFTGFFVLLAGVGIGMLVSSLYIPSEQGKHYVVGEEVDMGNVTLSVNYGQFETTLKDLHTQLKCYCDKETINCTCCYAYRSDLGI